jgi:ParB family chromosome partitioning protein
MSHFETVLVKPHEVIVVEGRNPRMMLLNIEQLAESIEENGVRNPIKVQMGDEGYELVDGHRRLAACQYLYDTKELVVQIPAIKVNHQSEADVLVEMLVSNDSELFAPFEEAILYARLRDEFKMNNEQIAQRVGKSVSHVSDKLALLRADETLKKAVEEKIISASDANTIVRKSKGSTEKQKELVQRVQKEGREQVIDKELKKGRLPKPAWALAEQAHDEVWSCAMNLNQEVCMDALESKNVREWLEGTFEENVDEVMFAFGLGQLEVFKNMSSLSMKELWDRLEERLAGK